MRLKVSLALKYPCKKNSSPNIPKSHSLRTPQPPCSDIYEMPRQRSKKLTASRLAERNSAPELERFDEQSDSDSSNESGGRVEKDEEEEELDRLVLGNGASFKAQLGQSADANMGYGQERGAELADDDSEEEGGLENVDDAEVRNSQLL